MHILGLRYVRFDTPDFDATEAFAKDFGLSTVDRRDDRLVMTTGGDGFSYVAHRAERAAFLGFGLEVASAADLDAAIADHHAEARRTLDTPGGGEAVTLTDPDGFRIDLLHGLPRITPPAGVTPDLRHNTPAERVRYGDNQHRREFGPATLFRLGHVGLFVRDFAESAAWYGRVLGMIGSDVYHLPHDPRAQGRRLLTAEPWRGLGRSSHHRADAARYAGLSPYLVRGAGFRSAVHGASLARIAQA